MYAAVEISIIRPDLITEDEMVEIVMMLFEEESLEVQIQNN